MWTERFLRLAAGDSGGGRARRLLRVWPLWERLAHVLWPAVPVPGSPHGLFQIHFKKHRGPMIPLSDGATVRSGEWVGELHFDNQAFLQALDRDGRLETGSAKWAIVSYLRDDLRALAAWTKSGTLPRPMVAIVGITVLGRGAVRLGFTMRPRAGRVLPYLDKLFVDGLLIIYTPEGVGRMTTGKTVADTSQEAWMSVDELLRRYGAGGDAARP